MRQPCLAIKIELNVPSITLGYFWLEEEKMKQIKEQVAIQTQARLSSFLIRINGSDLALDTHIGNSDECWAVIGFIDKFTPKIFDMFENSSLIPLIYLRVGEGDQVYVMDNDTTPAGKHGEQDYRLMPGNYLIGTSYGTMAIIKYEE